MSMRGPVTSLPLMLMEASVLVGEVPTLDNVTMTISSGLPTVLIGPNGSGKTTLLRAAAGLIPLSRGSISWGETRTQIPHNTVPEKLAIMFQHPVMLRRSAAGNIRYALAAAGAARSKRNGRVEELLNLVGLKGLGSRPARRLSGGEQQRLALARALACNPDVLFLDEPTSSLDPFSTKVIEDIIRSISARGVKVVMSTHDLGQAKRIAGDIVLLHRGRLIENSPATEFFIAPQTDDARKFIAGELLI
jgi:tungstate transport system ATP-binding protein